MTLFDVAKKNIKGNFNNYLIYFISMLASVMVYYIFVSLGYNQDIAKSIESSQSMASLFMLGSIILLLFVTVFMLYSNHFFYRSRKKEAGLYSLLGLPKRTVGKLFFFENMLMGAAVLFVGIIGGAFFSQLFSMLFVRILDVDITVGTAFSIRAIVNTGIVFAVIILFTSLQGYRLIYKYKLVELFQAEKEGEREPKTSVITAILAAVLIVAGYAYAYRDFDDNTDILINLSVMTLGIVAGTFLLFSSLVVFLLKTMRKRKRSYYKGMNIIGVSNLVYRIKGNANMLAMISILTALALCAVSTGFGIYYSARETARLTAPFSYMHIGQGSEFNRNIDEIIRADAEHSITARAEIPVIESRGHSSNSDILPEKASAAAENPVKIVSVDAYNEVANQLRLPLLDAPEEGRAIGIRPMYTGYDASDFAGERITLNLPNGDSSFFFDGMTVERIINWSYPDIMIVIGDSDFERVKAQIAPLTYIGYAVTDQKDTKATANALAGVKTPEAKLSTFYSVYRAGIEEAGFNVFILGFLGLIFIIATGSILYFKQLTEASVDKVKYDILKKIGISNKDIHRSLLKQGLFIFGLPLIIGLLNYAAIMNLLRRMFSGMASVDLTFPIGFCVIAFMLIYTLYYFFTVNAMNKTITGEASNISKWVTIMLIPLIAGTGIWLLETMPQNRSDMASIPTIELSLPKPTGHYEIGTTELHLRDNNRDDPWVPDQKRELMISIWYPAAEQGTEKAPYIHPLAAQYYDQNTIESVGLDSGTIDWQDMKTNAWIDAPAYRVDSGFPVVFYSPGGSVPRNLGTVVVEELASKGYIVVTTDHTYETSAVEFPGGRLLEEALPQVGDWKTILKMNDVRVDDMKYVLNQLEITAGGGNPDVEEDALPDGLATAFDLSKVGIYGHSAGGATAAQTMYEDDRFDAGIDMDGTMGHMPDHPLPVAEHGLDRPFMLMESGYADENDLDSHLTRKDRLSFWQQSTGWKYDIAVPKGMHYTYTDYQVLLPQMDSKLSLAPGIVQSAIGTSDAVEMLEAQRTYIAAFFDLHLKGIAQNIFELEESPFEEVEIVR
ncbi:FtsX-like permease family protein [Paenibacillus harenae]|uniref:FtsX-like permease family protein n=1 Tax=Paenibacillus harenae TaxID=306543 RepID=UPI0003FFDB50|nr:FtsX-like permease family protein [Paenibacillus harenae]